LGPDSPILTIDLLCPIARYLKGTILLDESYIHILLVCFVGTTRSSGAVRGKRTGSPPPKNWNLGFDSPILTRDLLCPIARYLKGTILLDESYIHILLVCFVGTKRSSGTVRGKRTGSPSPKKYLQNSLEFGVSPIRLLGVHFEALCFLFFIPTCFFYHLLPYFTSQKECIPFLQL
jgi:hypothetical protein